MTLRATDIADNVEKALQSPDESWQTPDFIYGLGDLHGQWGGMETLLGLVEPREDRYTGVNGEAEKCTDRLAALFETLKKDYPDFYNKILNI